MTPAALQHADEILRVLDDCSRAFRFPVLDNGYVYLAATRLSLHRSDTNWGLAIEVFGYAPRATRPHTAVYAFSRQPWRTRDPRVFADEAAYAAHLAVNPYNELTFAEPIGDSAWQDPDDWELVAEPPGELELRGKRVRTPTVEDCQRLGIALGDAPRIHVFEACRVLAATHRERVLATPAERRESFSPDLREILVLDEWRHPDLVQGEVVSDLQSFRQLAEVLATGDLRCYAPTLLPNTDWRNWPEGGSL